MVSSRAVLAAVVIPVAIVLLVILVIVIGRSNTTATPDCVSRAVDGSDALVCGTSPTAPTS